MKSEQRPVLSDANTVLYRRHETEPGSLRARPLDDDLMTREVKYFGLSSNLRIVSSLFIFSVIYTCDPLEEKIYIRKIFLDY